MEIYKSFKKDAVFRCSEHTKNFEAREINDINCIKEFDKELITFDARLLIATKAIDNGITLKDRKIKHIISDIFDLESMQQCLGRKRSIDINDKCKFYIRKYCKKEIAGFKGNTAKLFKPVELFVNNKDEYYKIYESNREHHSDFIYPEKGVLKYNKTAYWKLLDDMIVIEQMEAEGYKNVLLNMMGETITNIIDNSEEAQLKIEEDKKRYLNSIIGIKIYSKSIEKEKFINVLNFFNKNNRLVKGFKEIKKNIELKYEEYYLEEYTDWNRVNENGEKNNNYGKKYWMLKEVCQENCI